MLCLHLRKASHMCMRRCVCVRAQPACLPLVLWQHFVTAAPSHLRHDTRALALRTITAPSVFLSLEEGIAKWPPAPFKDILPKLEGFPSEDRQGEGSEECTPWGGLLAADGLSTERFIPCCSCLRHSGFSCLEWCMCGSRCY